MKDSNERGGFRFHGDGNRPDRFLLDERLGDLIEVGRASDPHEGAGTLFSCAGVLPGHHTSVNGRQTNF